VNNFFLVIVLFFFQSTEFNFTVVNQSEDVNFQIIGNEKKHQPTLT